MSGGLARFVLGAAMAVPGSGAWSEVRHVPSEYATINAALDASSAGDTVLVAPGTYSSFETRTLQGGGPFTASSVAFMRGGVALRSEGGPGVTRIDLQGEGVGVAVPVMAYGIGAGVTTVDGFTIAGAPKGNAGLTCQFLERMIVRDCRFEDLHPDAPARGTLDGESVDLEISDSEFLNCTSTGAAAAVDHADGNVVLERCSFRGCEAPIVVALQGNDSPPYHAVMRECIFQDNVGRPAGINSHVTVTVEDCEFTGNASTSSSALSVAGGPGNVIVPGPYIIRRNVFARNSTTSRNGTLTFSSVDGVVELNTFVDNVGRGLVLVYDAEHEITVRSNVFSGMTGYALESVEGYMADPPVSECNVFWNNPGGDIEGYPPGPTDQFVDPLFCAPDTGNYTVARNSPCLPPQSGSCGQIGAFGEGCTDISIEAESWGRTKAKFRGNAEERRRP